MLAELKASQYANLKQALGSVWRLALVGWLRIEQLRNTGAKHDASVSRGAC